MYIYPAVFEPNEDGSYTIFFPDIPGCISEGKNLNDAMTMARKALETWIDNSLTDGSPLPVSSNPNDITTEDTQFYSLIEADITAYRRRMDTAAVKRTLSLPRWLDTMADDAHLSLSKVLQDALCERLGVEESNYHSIR